MLELLFSPPVVFLGFAFYVLIALVRDLSSSTK